jgi:hypothetical protein
MNEQPEIQGMEQRNWTPRPDPTVLTTAALQREVAGLKELFETRLNAMDKAIDLLQATANKSPTIAVVDANGKRLEDVTNERFIGVAQKFDDLIAKIDQASVKDAKAVDAAFSAQKEAVAEQNKSNAQAISKSEAAINKQIESITSLQNTMDKATATAISDLKERITLFEGQKKGVETSYGMLIGLGGLAVTIGVLAVAIIGLYLKTQ